VVALRALLVCMLQAASRIAACIACHLAKPEPGPDSPPNRGFCMTLWGNVPPNKRVSVWGNSTSFCRCVAAGAPCGSAVVLTPFCRYGNCFYLASAAILPRVCRTLPRSVAGLPRFCRGSASVLPAGAEKRALFETQHTARRGLSWYVYFIYFIRGVSAHKRASPPPPPPWAWASSSSSSSSSLSLRCAWTATSSVPGSNVTRFSGTPWGVALVGWAQGRGARTGRDAVERHPASACATNEDVQGTADALVKREGGCGGHSGGTETGREWTRCKAAGARSHGMCGGTNAGGEGPRGLRAVLDAHAASGPSERCVAPRPWSPRAFAVAHGHCLRPRHRAATWD